MSNDFGNANPYEATAPAPGAIPPGELKKPTSMVVFGILNLVFGAFGILGLVILFVSMFLDLPQDPNPIQELMNDPTFKMLNIGLQVLATVLVLMLLTSGIGLINGKVYGRRLAINYALGAMLLVVASSAVNICYIALPAFEIAKDLPDGEEKIQAIVSGSAYMVQPVCGFIYPILLLIFMMRAPVKNYFRV